MYAMTETTKNENVPQFPNNPPPYTSQPMPGPPPPQMYGPTYVQATVVPTVVPVVVGQQMSPTVVRTTCKSCHLEIATRIELRSTMRTHLIAAFLCLFGCWPCVCVPYCMDTCNNVDHYCPNCNSYLGSYVR